MPNYSVDGSAENTGSDIKGYTKEIKVESTTNGELLAVCKQGFWYHFLNPDTYNLFTYTAYPFSGSLI